MTLDEAIERELYRVEANRDMADSFHTDENIYSKEEEAFRNREDYHSQIAEWLRELKEYRKFYSCYNCYNASASFNEYPCNVCRRGLEATKNIKDHYKEVNADEE